MIPEKVEAKFKCSSVEEFAGGYKEAKLQAVYGNGGGNEDFAEATPSGDVSITISPGRLASDFFKPGAEYYLDFTQAED